MTAVLATIQCLQCASVFEAPYRTVGTPLFCSDDCRRARKSTQDREHWRTRKLTYLATPERALANRARNAAWSHERRGVRTENVWLKGPPPFGSHLPGGAIKFSCRPLPSSPVELRHTRGLHGALTTLIGVGHLPSVPVFSLLPWGTGWALYAWHESAMRLANRTMQGVLFDRPTVFSFGPLIRIKAPQVARRGRHKVAVETLTPVIIKSRSSYTGRVHAKSRPTVESIRATMESTMLEYLGLEWMRPQFAMDIVADHTKPVRAQIGGKFGTYDGWEGRVEMDVNAPTMWLLQAAASLGLGSRRGFGYGRIRVVAR